MSVYFFFIPFFLRFGWQCARQADRSSLSQSAADTHNTYFVSNMKKNQMFFDIDIL